MTTADYNDLDRPIEFCRFDRVHRRRPEHH
jgi:hypothetical protein